MMTLNDEFFNLARQLQQRQIDYAVVGGFALAFHDIPRLTKDIDILIKPDDLESVVEMIEGLGYHASAPPWTFQKTRVTLHRFLKVEEPAYVFVDILAGHEAQHRTIIERAWEEPWADGVVKFASKEDLIWMKRQRGSDQDQVDIRRLQDDED